MVNENSKKTADERLSDALSELENMEMEGFYGKGNKDVIEGASNKEDKEDKEDKEGEDLMNEIEKELANMDAEQEEEEKEEEEGFGNMFNFDFSKNCMILIVILLILILCKEDIMKMSFFKKLFK
tara:strand:+ start:360 stop:734 length:375 start_codon:yes stop_codon:yes gene_type:complete